jgi:peptide/nickel transport system substrate-binding protein
MRRCGLAVFLACVTALAVGCMSEDDEATRTTDDIPRGGTLRIGTTGPAGEGGSIPTLDPALPNFFAPEVSELHRCCLLRTLVNYRGATTEDGGAVLRPDLAVALPTVSDDGLTYTFRLKSGLRYAPPYDDVSIRSRDVVRAVEYALGLGPGFTTETLLVIEGASAFRDKRAGAVSGLETPDEQTLVVHLTRRVGDLAERFSLAVTAPIPEGADVGHTQLGRIPVASGPYMIEGSAAYDFSRAPTRSRLPAGYTHDTRLSLVRNPSWSNDPLRGAYADRIALTAESSPESAAAKVDNGSLDVALGQLSPPPEQIRRYAEDPELRKRLFAHVGSGVRYVNMNVAVPPFDDLQVRKAVSLAIDKQALQRAARGGLGGRIAGHIAPDAFLNNLLLDYDPHETPGHRGDVDAARKEMAKSRYDRNGDGRCDVPACRGLVAPVRKDDPTNVELGRLVRDDLQAIGIELAIKALDFDTYFGEAILPEAKAPIIPSLGWGADVLNASGIFAPLFSGALVGHPSGSNLSLVGATQSQLKRLGYLPRPVPSVDAKLAECVRLTGRAQTQCWAETDQLLMERIVPHVPYLFEGATQVVSGRVARFTLSQASFGLMPAFDQIALKSGSA